MTLSPEAGPSDGELRAANIMRARVEILGVIDRLMAKDEQGREHAIAAFISSLDTNEVLRNLVHQANARRHDPRTLTISRATIFRWISRRERSGDLALLPERTKPHPAAAPSWVADIIALLEPSLEDAYRQWVETGRAPSPPPSMKQVRDGLMKVGYSIRETKRRRAIERINPVG